MEKEAIDLNKNKKAEVDLDKSKKAEVDLDKSKKVEVNLDKSKKVEVNLDKNKKEEVNLDKNKKEEVNLEENKKEEIDQEKEEILPEDKAESLIRKHTYAALGLGLIPIPFIDFVGVTGIQLNMVRKLANVYDVSFTQEAFKNSVGSIIGGAIPGLAGMPLTSLMKTVPILGQALGLLTMPVVAGASTYAIGKVFYHHFATGGTFLTLDPDLAREYYKEQYAKGEKVASEMMEKKKAS